jgi:ribose/xylose/arabinose/galactoside ABC-type transport system permease subunit
MLCSYSYIIYCTYITVHTVFDILLSMSWVSLGSIVVVLYAFVVAVLLYGSWKHFTRFGNEVFQTSNRRLVDRTSLK